jgi:hypothetical protein
LLHEYASLHPAQSPKPPEEGSDPVHEEALQLPDGLQLSPQAFGELPKGFFILPGEGNLLREQSVPQDPKVPV